MMPVLAFPLGLAALAGWVAPLLIHLARRTETRPADFAALRWLRQKPRPRHRPRFDERLLLAVRLLLVALLALWLARPVLPGSADRTAVVAFAPGLVPVAGAGRRVWLAPGFPAIEDGVPATGVPIDSLVRELDANLPAGVPLTLVVPAQLDGVDAERPRLSRAVTWWVVPGRVVPGGAGIVGSVAAPPDLVVRYAPERVAQLRYWRATAIAWAPAGQAPRFAAATTDVAVPADARHLVWLAGGPLPAAVQDWIARGGTALVARDLAMTAHWTVAWRDATGLPLAETVALGRGRVVRLVRDLTPATMPVLLDARFPAQLRTLLMPRSAPGRAMAQDHAPVTGGLAPDVPVRDLRLPLAIAIAALWLTERWLATQRRRAAMP